MAAKSDDMGLTIPKKPTRTAAQRQRDKVWKDSLPKLAATAHHQAENFYFRFGTPSKEEPGKFNFHGWASFTLNEDTGEVNIQSDWGNASHWWGFEGRGKRSLKDFLADRTSVGYLVDKLCRTEELKDVYDGDETLKKLKEDFRKNTRNKDLSKEMRAGCIEALESVCREIDGKHEVSYAWDIWRHAGNRECAEEVKDFLSDEDFAYALCHRMSAWAYVWKELLLPTFIDHLKSLGFGGPRKPEPPSPFDGLTVVDVSGSSTSG